MKYPLSLNARRHADISTTHLLAQEVERLRENVSADFSADAGDPELAALLQVATQLRVVAEKLEDRR